MLVVGVAHAANPSYGAGFFEVMGSVYPEIAGSGTEGDVILGMVYGLVDGALGGLLVAWVYKFFLRRFNLGG